MAEANSVDCVSKMKVCLGPKAGTMESVATKVTWIGRKPAATWSDFGGDRNSALLAIAR